MTQPKQAFDDKIKFLNEAERRLDDLAIGIQDMIWSSILPLFEMFGDRIEPDDVTVKNIGKLETEAFKSYRQFTSSITDQVIKDFERINELNDDYFSSYAEENTEGYQEGVDYSNNARIERLGIAANELVVDGFLNSFKQNPQVLAAIRTITFAAITTGLLKKTLINRMRKLILGDSNQGGISQTQVNKNLNDQYNNFDSLTQQQRADRLGLRVAIYSNSLVQDSRCFCRNKFNKAWTIEEISEFEASTRPNENSEGANCKAIYETTLYDPFVHRGGYNCRHVYRYVPKRVAIRFRPDLQEYYDELDEQGAQYL